MYPKNGTLVGLDLQADLKSIDSLVDYCIKINRLDWQAQGATPQVSWSSLLLLEQCNKM